MTHNHLLCDFWLTEETCELLRYVDPLQAILIEAAEAGGAHVCHAHFRQFLPEGVTGFLLLEESHISLHTWVEEGYAALDIFSCGAVDNGAILEYLTDRLQPRRVDLLWTERGCPGDMYGATTISRPSPPSMRVCQVIRMHQ